MYVVVEYTDNNELAVIPDNWLEGTGCAVWPNIKSSKKLNSAIMQYKDPESDWKAYPVRIMYKCGKCFNKL